MSPVRQPRREAQGRRRDAAFLLPALCALILLPPFVNLFVREVLIWGVPLEMVYLFGVWSVLVLGAVILSRRLSDADADGRCPGDEAARGRDRTAPGGGSDR